MKTIGKNSKLGRHYLYAYEHSTMYSLFGAYKKPSSRKIKADNFCRGLYGKEQGYNYKIIAASTFAFTAAWQTAQGLRIETAYNSYIVK